MKHTAEAIRAAEIISDYLCIDGCNNNIVAIIEDETHAAEMLAFIEKVAAFDFEGNKNLYDKVIQAQSEAFELIKKVRG